MLSVQRDDELDDEKRLHVFVRLRATGRREDDGQQTGIRRPGVVELDRAAGGERLRNAERGRGIAGDELVRVRRELIQRQRHLLGAAAFTQLELRALIPSDVYRRASAEIGNVEKSPVVAAVGTTDEGVETLVVADGQHAAVA